MKLQHFIVALLVGVSFVSCQEDGTNDKLNTNTDSVSYVMGALDGGRVIGGLEQAKLTDAIKMNIYREGFLDAAKGTELKIDPKANMAMAQTFLKKHSEYKMATENDSTGTIPEFSATEKTLDSVSYILGASDGQGLKNSFEQNGIDTVIDVNLYLKGFSKTVAKEDLGLVPDDHMPMVQEFFSNLQKERLEAEFGENKKIGANFLATNKERPEVTTTESGLQYEVIKEGKGNKPTETDKVKVHYHGTLIDGTVFDSSVDRGEPAEFPLNRVIKGWTEGLQYMTVGSKYKFYIPYDLAYGESNQGAIKPFSTLIFDVELLDIVKE